jgi:hypothetical protein
MRGDYYTDERYCPHCNRHVQYLLALEASYCVRCGGAVRLWSAEEQARFQRSAATPDERRGHMRRAGGRQVASG